jgi:hypothetical protein
MDMEVIIMVMVMVMDMGSTSMENLGSVGSMVGLVLASLSMENLARDGSDAEDNNILNMQL